MRPDGIGPEVGVSFFADYLTALYSLQVQGTLGAPSGAIPALPFNLPLLEGGALLGSLRRPCVSRRLTPHPAV